MIKYTSLTYAERVKIETLLSQKYNPYKISKILNRSTTTIYNEIKRGSVMRLDSATYIEKLVYYADSGQRVRNDNFNHSGAPLKIGSDVCYLAYIEKLVKVNHLSMYSALMYIKNNNIQFNTSLSKATLYNYYHKGLFLSLHKSDMPYKHNRFNKHSSQQRPAFNNRYSRSIDERPQYINDRSEYGHYECDTVQSCKNDNTCLLVMTERKTRKEIIRKIKDKTSESVLKEMDSIFKNSFNVKTIKSITFDNGCEFMGWKTIEQKYNIPCYFCHAYSAYERGSNEYNNRIIRRFIKKGTCIKKCSKKYIAYVEKWLNDLPRKILNGLSAYQYEKSIINTT